MTFSRTPKDKQRGVALITALLVVALAATAATRLTTSHQLSIRRTGNIINGDQAYQYVLGVESLAMHVLHEDFKDNKVDSCDDEWAGQSVTFPVQGGVVSGRLYDLHGRINLNSIVPSPDGPVNAVARERFSRLLTQFEINPAVTDAVIDWIDQDADSSGAYGAEDDFYISQEPAYRTANFAFTSVSELRMVRGFRELEQPVFDGLTQHLSAIIGSIPININTAPQEVLQAIGVPPSLAASLTQVPCPPPAADEEENNGNSTGRSRANPARAAGGQRRRQGVGPFETVTEFVTTAGLKGTPGFSSEGLSTQSQYFLYEGEAVVGQASALLKSLIYRDNTNGSVRVIIRSRSDL